MKKQRLKYPANPSRFRSRTAELYKNIKSDEPVMKFDFIAVRQYRGILAAYYGSEARAAFVMLKESLYHWRHSINHRFILWIVDKAGWTKIVDVPETSTHHAYKLRHGHRCTGSPNCTQHCIERDIPAWFKFIVRWDKIHE